jgi:hypothetical protein
MQIQGTQINTDNTDFYNKSVKISIDGCHPCTIFFLLEEDQIIPGK